MIERLHPPAPHVVALRAGGRITSEDVGRAQAALDDALKRHDRVSFFVVLDGVGWIDPAALLRDLGYSLGQLKNLPRFHRAAVVTGQGWVRAAVGAEDALLPGVEARAFAPGDRAAAEAWVAERPGAVAPGVVWAPQPRPDALALTVTGPVRAEDVAAFRARLDAVDGPVDLFVGFERGLSLGLDALGGDLVRNQIDAARRVRRCALVGAPGWLAAAAGLFEPLAPVAGSRLRHFEAGEGEAAWAWLDAGREPSGDGQAGAARALPPPVAALPDADAPDDADQPSADPPSADPPADDLGTPPPAGEPPPLP
jgi:hypothetical protein